MIEIEAQEIRKSLPKSLQDKLKALNDLELKYLSNEILIRFIKEQCNFLEHFTK